MLTRFFRPLVLALALTSLAADHPGRGAPPRSCCG
jgi:hypothetical protein